MHLVRATPADLDALLPLVAEFYVVDDHPYDEATLRDALLPLLRDDAAGQVWLIDASEADEDDAADDGGDLTDEAALWDGYAVLTWGWSLESGGRDCLLDEFYVRTSGRGTGRAALTQLMEIAAAAGAKRMMLETEAPNDRARAFYARSGFGAETSTFMSRYLRDLG
jgi:GNAT superfamily N-acetyltransferase